MADSPRIANDADWFAARRWQETPLYARCPAAIADAMAALAELVTSAWYREQLLAVQAAPHPLALALTYPHYITIWPAIAVGLSLARVGAIPDFLRRRLLHREEFPGAASELSAAAALTTHNVAFDWYPVEGGEFRVHEDPVRYIEVKRPQYSSSLASLEVAQYMQITAEVCAASPTPHISLNLKPNLLDAHTLRQRAEFDWGRLRVEALDAVRDVVRAGELPAMRQLQFGTLWMARSREELVSVGGGGFGGLYFKESHEHERVIRATVKKALRQLPAGQPVLVVLDWSAASNEFARSLAEYLENARVGRSAAGVMVRRATFVPGDYVPSQKTWMVANPRDPTILGSSRAAAAVAVDPFAHLRASQEKAEEQRIIPTVSEANDADG
ncbi:MAG: hypothetical protein K8W52_10205 [Deltaproteobacteria bacterium]|nr:hypothetical protein [Deltaproteobacteria bacterium]